MPFPPWFHPFKSLAKLIHRIKKASGHRDVSSRFLNWLDQSRILHRSNQGLLIDGKQKRLSERDSFCHLALLSPTGGGKTTTFVLPNLLTLDHCSICVTDPSGELFDTCSGYLKQKGFNVRVLNLQEPVKGSGYNPVAHANTHLEIDKLANTIMSSTGGQSKDPMWERQAANLISVFIQCLKNTADPSYMNLHNVLHLIQHWDVHPKNPNSLIMNFVNRYCGDDPTIMNQFKGFLAGSPNMISCFITLATDALHLLNNTDIASMLSRNEFDFHELRKQKTVVFLIVPETDSKLYQFIINSFWTQLFDSQKELRYKTEGLPIYCLMDEFGHGKIKDFASVSTTIRKYRISLSIILQSITQLEENYGKNDANTILSGGMRSKLFLAGLDLQTSEMVEKMLGKKRLAVRPGAPEFGLREETLLPADRIRRLYDNEALYLVSNEEPTLISTTPYYQHRKFKQVHKYGSIELTAQARLRRLDYIPLDLEAENEPIETQISGSLNR